MSTPTMSTSKNNPKHPNNVAQNLPPEPNKKGLRPVKKPLETTRLSRLIYTLVLLTTLLAAYYSYRTLQYETRVGPWWNLIFGRKPPVQSQQPADAATPVEHCRHPDSVEDKLNDLAKALGMPTRELASAIAVAVRNYVPPASLSSIAAKETGPVVRVLLENKGSPIAATTVEASPTPTSTGTSILGEVVEGVNKFVGMDEP